MKSFIPYFGLSAIAAVFALWFWYWGLSQGSVNGISKVPESFTIINIIASVLFFGSAWLVLYKGSKNLKTTSYLLIGLIIWFALVVGLGSMGFFAATPLFAPNIIFAFILMFIGIKVALSISKIREIFEATPLHLIMLVQVFRVMGVGFLTLYYMKVLPGVFAIPTGVGDILIGVTAPIIAYIYLQKKSYSKKVAILWNLAGIADLIMALTLGNLTYSKPIQVISTKIPNDPIALFPLVIIPVFAVPLSLILHFYSLRILKKQP